MSLEEEVVTIIDYLLAEGIVQTEKFTRADDTANSYSAAAL